MKHYGDITKLNGAELPVVDVITGGSPCQNLSQAGNRKGLEGEESKLFLEQIRIVKEMREHDRRTTGRTAYLVRPRYMVWENVPGAFSSNKGRDFQIVLTEIVRIVQPDAPDVPLPSNGRWNKSGCLMGYGEDGCPFSIAYRVHDAQFWGKTIYADGRILVSGTPQRRRRLALVADFGGRSAPEILFERKGLHGDLEESEGEGEDAAGRIADGIRIASSFQERSGRPGGAKASLSNETGQEHCQRSITSTPSADRGGWTAVEHHPMDSRTRLEKDGMIQTLNERMGTGGNNVPLVMRNEEAVDNRISCNSKV